MLVAPDYYGANGGRRSVVEFTKSTLNIPSLMISLVQLLPGFDSRQAYRLFSRKRRPKVKENHSNLSHALNVVSC